jgi:hypothetical protein
MSSAVLNKTPTKTNVAPLPTGTPVDSLHSFISAGLENAKDLASHKGTTAGKSYASSRLRQG